MFERVKADDWSSTIGIATRVVILFAAVLPVPLAAAQGLGLTADETASWIMAIYGLTGLLSVAFVLFFRQPLVATANLFALIFVVSISQEFHYPQLIGAFIVAGAGVLLISAFNLTGRLAAWLPAPIIFGLLSGAVISIVWEAFTALGQAPLLVGGTLLAYLLGRRFLSHFLPAILPALVVGLLIAGLTGQIGPLPERWLLPAPQFTAPAFSLPAIVTISPILVVLIVLQANLPSIIFLREEGYEPPVRAVDTASGLGAILGSLIGPIGVSLSLPITSLVAGPEAGAVGLRRRAALLAGAGAVVIGLFAGFAAELPAFIPPALLATLAGLALFNVLVNALQKVTEGPLVLGPVSALAVSLSDISLLGFGPFFWALVVGVTVSLLLERDAMRALAREKGGETD